MPSFDSIVVGEDWISEHFFTTDSTKESFQAEVIKLRKSWDEQAKEGHATTLSRFSEVRGRLQILLAGLAEDPAGAREAYALLRTALGFKGTTAAVTFERSGTETLVPGVWKTENADVVFLEAGAADAAEDVLSSVKPLGCVLVDGKEMPSLTIAKVVSEIYLAERSPKYVVVMAGRWLVLTEQERWAEGRYLAADALLVADRNDTRKHSETDRFLAILGRDSLMPTPDGSIWWDDVLAASVKHTVGVSQDLRAGIRRSIEIIANDVLKRRAARGLPVDEVDGQDLARQSLRFLYRILFLLYAEASPEMGVLPIGAGEYNEGYGLDRLRELTLVNIQSHESQRGTHIYESLERLFRLVDSGHKPRRGSSAAGDPTGDNEGLVFQPLKADLFQESATSLINDAKLSNSELQRVLQHLLLSKEARGKDRGFISYAELGINQLGAVYEGLMSYTGFIAAEPLYEVAKDGNPEKGSWVVPVDRSESIDAKHFVKIEDERTGEKKLVLHETGSFVFRLAGRERQQSASYYTPEVLTKFVVSQALEELLDQDGRITPADDILKLTVCEPALGSGAFAIEAVRQLADEYLKRKQKELDQHIPADEYPQELQKVKAQIALHQVHGVDLNSTAVELAEVSLWLDTMVKDLQAPWFGLRLRRGNSLIGSRRATYSRQAVNDITWLKSEPAQAPLSGLVGAMEDDTDDPNVVSRIHHFLLPAEGWGVAAEAAELENLAGDAQRALKSWRASIKAKPSRIQLDRLVALGTRVEALWKLTLRRLQVAETEARREIDYFGKRPPVGESVETSSVTREQIEQSLKDENGSYQRLRRAMDAWNALWFWPLTEGATGRIQPPSLEEWVSALEGILGVEAAAGKISRKYGLIEGQTSVLSMASWGELEAIESFDFSTSQVQQIGVIKTEHPWLGVCQQVAEEQGFFHWELDFASVFARGGFDLQVGNPPWVRPRIDEPSLLAEGDPWWQVGERVSAAEKEQRRKAVLSMPGMPDIFVSGISDVLALAAFLGSGVEYPVLSGLQPDLYRCFMSKSWSRMNENGISALIHLESHFTDERGELLRSHTYRRLRRHWEFINELKLFEIKDQKRYGVNVYGHPRSDISFLSASHLYHPETVIRSLQHDGSGEEPGIKDEEGKWDLRPHRDRIESVTVKTLEAWRAVMEEDNSALLHTRMVHSVNKSAARALEKLTEVPRVGVLQPEFSGGWGEGKSQQDGIFELSWGEPSSWEEVILQGPHMTANDPWYKSPNPSMLHQQDWKVVSHHDIGHDDKPVTCFKPKISTSEIDRLYTRWSTGEPSRSTYRIFWRTMAANTGVRTLTPAIYPPGTTHVDGVYSLGLPNGDLKSLVALAGQLGSVISDFSVRVAPKSTIRAGAISRLRATVEHPLIPQLLLRTLRLNCLTNAYAPLWEEVFLEDFGKDSWVGGINYEGRPALGDVTPNWTSSVPLHADADRRQAELEIDAIVAVMFGLSAHDLQTLYRTQFPVLAGYDQRKFGFDQRGKRHRLQSAVQQRSISRTDIGGDGPQADPIALSKLPVEACLSDAHERFSSMLGENF